ncbi:MAG: hypothetical protein IJR82_05290, partial [Bacilli bacterium]|nr:hypothetical protein [Bacilli bacterium]
NATLNGWIHADGTKSNHTTENELSTDIRAAIINFTNNSDWTKVGDYYYYNYRLAPGQTTDSIIESVTFNALTKLGDTCITSSENGIKTITCNSSGEDYDHATYKLTVNIETVQYNKYQEAWNTNFAIASEKPVSGVDTLLTNAVNTSGTEYNELTKSKMFVMTHPRTDQTPAQTEYRYIGDNPNNYIYFNCDSLSNQNSNTCEIWRIIGVFDVDDGTGNYEQRIKLVRGSALPDTKQWDTRTSEMYPNDNWGKNEWEGSIMETYLNDEGEYYTRTGTAANYGLKATAKSLIGSAKYYLGGTHYDNENAYGSADAMYLWERGSEVYNQNNATRNTSWVGEVSLMYPSDQYLVYANGVDAVCYGNPKACYIADTSSNGTPNAGWIYNSNNLEGQNGISDNWFVSPYSSNSNSVFNASSVGSFSDNRGIYFNGARPVVYLKSNIKIIEGTGERTNPYKLGL